MRRLAAARLSQVSGPFVAEIQTVATLMLGAKRKKKASVKSLAVSYSVQSKISFATCHLFNRSGAAYTLL